MTATRYGRPGINRSIQVRRVWWFSRIVERFDLIALADLADWCARSPGGFDRDEVRRAQALSELERSIEGGEFGPAIRPRVAYLPKIAPDDRIGRFPIRLAAAQLAYMRAMGHALTTDLFLFKSDAVTWFERQQILPPPGLMGSAEQQTTIEGHLVEPAAALTGPKAPAIPRGKTGPKGNATEKAAKKMLADLEEGKASLKELATMKRETLAFNYGLKRTAAKTALDRAASLFAGVPNSDN